MRGVSVREKWSSWCTSLLLVSVVFAGMGGCAGESSGEGAPVARQGAGQAGANGSEAVAFVDRAREVGLDFVHFNGMTGERWLVEMMGAGAALFDSDGDGDLDVYFVQGDALGSPEDGASFAFDPPSPLPLSDRLYRNELVETGTLAFTDVTEAAGLARGGYGLGVAAGDFDGDGHVDLYVTRLGANALLRNRGDGTFDDVTAASGTEEGRFSTSACFVDYDRDGRLDLFVCNYVDFSVASHKDCFGASGRPDYCNPKSYDAYPDRLFRNRGDGTFEDATGAARVASEYGGALGVVARDFNGDGWPDFYVCNDGLPNQLWMNTGEGHFENRALLAGCAYNALGEAEASMGVDAVDVDGDGDEDLFMTHLSSETNTLYLNDGRGNFDDATAVSGLGAASRTFTGFGTSWIDYDNDGLPDLVSFNGAVTEIAAQGDAGDPLPLRQRDQLFRNLGAGPRGPTFREATAAAGPDFARLGVSRGAAFGDVDNDGDIDIVVVDNAGAARLLVNQVGQDAHWLGLRLLDRPQGRDQLGARVSVQREGGGRLLRRSHTDGSFCSSNDPRVLVGLGGTSTVTQVEVQWPDGAAESWDWAGRATDAYHDLIRGTGMALR